jgi:hypothetical protein
MAARACGFGPPADADAETDVGEDKAVGDKVVEDKVVDDKAVGEAAAESEAMPVTGVAGESPVLMLTDPPGAMEGALVVGVDGPVATTRAAVESDVEADGGAAADVELVGRVAGRAVVGLVAGGALVAPALVAPGLVTTVDAIVGGGLVGGEVDPLVGVGCEVVSAVVGGTGAVVGADVVVELVGVGPDPALTVTSLQA